jgi:D-sedoheptulose 7-phosphate isomerase
VAKALLLARAIRVTTMAMTGESGGVLKNSADLCLCVPSRDTPRIQEGHILMGHALADLVERELFVGR